MRKPSPLNLSALVSAALALPGASAHGQSPVEPELRVSFDSYRDVQPGADRMRINSPSVWLRAPVAERTSVQGSFVLDSISGASPYYFNTLSSASIRDSRKAAQVSVDHAFDRFGLTVGGAFSSEDDFESVSGKIEGRAWSEDKNTLIAAGVSVTSDDIGSTLDPLLSESRTGQGYLLGVTQLINPLSMVQMNLTYNSGDGFFTDPYKTYDNRPRSREQYAWLTRYVLYLPEVEAALHADYRLYSDSFGLSSHMIELSIYQPVMSSWIIRPSVRYYSQRRADFFRESLPEEQTGFFSADQRLGDFGALTAGVKIIKDLGAGFSAHISFDYIEQRPEWKLGGAKTSPEIQQFYAHLVSFGVVKKF